LLCEEGGAAVTASAGVRVAVPSHFSLNTADLLIFPTPAILAASAIPAASALRDMIGIGKAPALYS